MTRRHIDQLLLESLYPQLSFLSEQQRKEIKIIPIEGVDKSPDSSREFLLSLSGQQKFGVILLSPEMYCQCVSEMLDLTTKIKTTLGSQLGAMILDPLVQGEIDSLSYALFPYCTPLSSNRLLLAIQKRIISRPVLHWLRGTAEQTVKDVSKESLLKDYIEPLKYIAQLSIASKQFKNQASKAIEKINHNTWNPKYVVMHGDLWKGNILMKNNNKLWGLSNNLIFIDWAGAKIEGYPIYDLICFTRSMNLSQSILKVELQAHAEILGCEREDLMFYLLAALGKIGLEPGCFTSFQYSELLHFTTKILSNE